eukprot:6201836-Pleurochrysis_carterae.AAC.2
MLRPYKYAYLVTCLHARFGHRASPRRKQRGRSALNEGGARAALGRRDIWRRSSRLELGPRGVVAARPYQLPFVCVELDLFMTVRVHIIQSPQPRCSSHNH